MGRGKGLGPIKLQTNGLGTIINVVCYCSAPHPWIKGSRPRRGREKKAAIFPISWQGHGLGPRSLKWESRVMGDLIARFREHLCM